jgi:hypothetical protein
VADKHCSLGEWIHDWEILPAGDEPQVDLDLNTHRGRVTADATFGQAQSLLEDALSQFQSEVPMVPVRMVGSVT